MANLLLAAVASGAVSLWVIDGLGARVKGTPHDLSAQPWAGTKICRPCHTPHNADTTVVAEFLWNHQVTSAVYTLYDSPTMDVQTQQPGTASRLCLSCHDGTVAVDSFGGQSGNYMIDGDALVGTDLSNDHPVGIQWDHQTSTPSCANCHSPHGGGGPALLSTPLKFYDGRIECGTCHDAHAATANPNFLRVTMTGSELCMGCHGL